MGWSELLTSFVSARAMACEGACERLRASLRELLEALDGLEEASLRPDPESGEQPWELRVLRLRRRAAELDLSPLDELGGLLPWRRADLQELSGGLSKALRTLTEQLEQASAQGSAPAALGARPELVLALRRLERLAAGGRRRQARRLLWVKVALLLPVALAALAGLRTLWLSGVTVETVLPLQPGGGLRRRPHPSVHDFAFDEAYEGAFLKEFERHYFRRPSEFERLFAPGKNGHGGSQRFQIVLRNQDRYGPLLVSRVAATVRKLRPRPFPWERLDPTPKLQAEQAQAAPNVLLRNAGRGPAVDVRWVLSAEGGQVLGQAGTRLVTDTQPVELEASASGIGQVHVLDGGRLATPLFFHRPAPAPPAPAPAPDGTVPMLEMGSGDFAPGGPGHRARGDVEVVHTLERLATLTSVTFGGPYKLHVTYESLAHERYELTHRGLLPSDRAFYAQSDNLSERAGSGLSHGPGLGLDSLRAHAAPLLPRAMDVARHLAGPPPEAPEPGGQDLLKVELSVPAGELAHGVTRVEAKQPDTFLNAKGALVVYVTLLTPDNGDYEVELQVNGGGVTRWRTECLIPERLVMADFHDARAWAAERARWSTLRGTRSPSETRPGAPGNGAGAPESAGDPGPGGDPTGEQR